MTLLEMIKKYEDAKAILEKQRPELPILASIGDAEEVLEDLKSIRDQQPSWVTIRVKVLARIDKALDNDDPDGAQTWAHVLQILPK